MVIAGWSGIITTMAFYNDVRPGIFDSWGEALTTLAGLVFAGALVIAVCVLVLTMVVDLVLILK